MKLSTTPFFGKKEDTKEVQIFNNSEFGEIRTVKVDNEPWFVAKDLAFPLGYAQVANMSKLVDEEDKKIISSSVLDEQGQSYNMTVINESGLYAAIFGSKQKNAKRFKKWVTSEVLPTIRKTGSYGVPKTAGDQILLLAEGYREMRERIDDVSDTVNEVKSDFDTFKEDCPCFPSELEKITQAARRKGLAVMGGKSSMAYHDRSIVQLVYRDIYGQIHRNFGCNSYKDIARKNVDKVLAVIDNYSLPMVLLDRISQANANV